jgi:hypothetical protein
MLAPPIIARAQAARYGNAVSAKELNCGESLGVNLQLIGCKWAQSTCLTLLAKALFSPEGSILHCAAFSTKADFHAGSDLFWAPPEMARDPTFFLLALKFLNHLLSLVN